jgi:regulator of cell morphogenesis and NO signaling
MTIAPNTPLREIVTDNPATADLFDVLDIDYFCRGSRLLGDALNEHSVSLDAFAGELARVDQRPPVPDWRMATLRTLIGHIVDIYHERLRRELPALDEAIHRLDSEPASSKPASLPALHRIVHQLRCDLELQMQKEEAILFPAIAELERSAPSRPAPTLSQFGSVANLSRVMGKEHEKTAHALREIGLLTNNFTAAPDGSGKIPALFVMLRALTANMHRHVHLENNVLYPRAIELEKGGYDGPR